MIFSTFIEQIIFKNDKNSSRSFRRRWNSNDHMSCGINRSLLFANNCVHAKIHFIVHNRLLDATNVNNSFLVLNITIVHLKTHKHCVVAASIESNRVNTNTMRFVSLAGRMNDQSLLFSLHHIDELLLFYGCYHYGSSFGVHCQIVAWDDAPTARFAKTLFVSFAESFEFFVVVENDDFSRIGTYDN